ncbi:hypothetical protein CEP52_004360 [Fusarium oligoseptatum]|uniref:Uncharacterized protein n=1 Tax=Fusarium oligoseptatum TaxID=2604345 RepID=A0A428U433_9HYPO|nr:hypothetical protein CEP52_004360 [Fusarium oligoseptatum]
MFCSLSGVYRAASVMVGRTHTAENRMVKGVDFASSFNFFSPTWTLYVAAKESYSNCQLLSSLKLVPSLSHTTVMP